jgi:hypothetical protein
VNVTAESVVASKLRCLVAELREMATDGGRRAVDARWVAGAIKRVVVPALQPWLGGKCYGAMAAAKIALAKAVTLDDLERIAAKLDAPPAE